MSRQDPRSCSTFYFAPQREEVKPTTSLLGPVRRPGRLAHRAGRNIHRRGRKRASVVTEMRSHWMRSLGGIAVARSLVVVSGGYDRTMFGLV